MCENSLHSSHEEALPSSALFEHSQLNDPLLTHWSMKRGGGDVAWLLRLSLLLTLDTHFGSPELPWGHLTGETTKRQRNRELPVIPVSQPSTRQVSEGAFKRTLVTDIPWWPHHGGHRAITAQLSPFHIPDAQKPWEVINDLYHFKPLRFASKC